MKALGDSTSQANSMDCILDDRSPLIEKPNLYGADRSTFDNIALSSEDKTLVHDNGDTNSDDDVGFKDSGIVESSFASLDLSDYSSKCSDDSSTPTAPVKEEEVKRRKPKLKLVSSILCALLYM